MNKTLLEKIHYMLEMLKIAAEIQFGTYATVTLEPIQGQLSIVFTLQGHVIPTQEKIDTFIGLVKHQWLADPELNTLGVYFM